MRGVARELFEWVEHSQPGATEVSIVSRDDGESIPLRGGCNVAVFNRDAPACLFELVLQVCPDVRRRHIETVDASVHRCDEPGQPRLERLALPPLFRSDPVGQLSDHHRARVALIPFSRQPGDNPRITAAFGRLAQNVGIDGQLTVSGVAPSRGVWEGRRPC